MMVGQDIKRLFEWSSSTMFPLRKDRVASKHMGYTSNICYIKFGKDKKFYPNKNISKSVLDIIQRDEILGVYFISYPPKIDIKIHTDHNPYKKRYLRIQIPITIPNNNINEECFVEWIECGQRIYWKIGETMIFDVEKLHYGANKSDSKMEFLYVDINPDTKVEL